MIKDIFSFLKKTFKISARYQILLAGKPHYIASLDDIVCKIKYFGDHQPFSVSATELLTNNSYKTYIDPESLMLVHSEWLKLKKICGQYKISKIKKDHSFLIYNSWEEISISGDDLLNNPVLVEKIKPIDIARICFEHGYQSCLNNLKTIK